MTNKPALLSARDGLLRRAARLPAIGLAIGLTGACVGTGEGVPFVDPDATVVPTTFEELHTMILDPMCAQQCHRGGAAPKGLSMERSRVIRALVGVPSVEVPVLLRVAPGSPEQSYLVVKLATSDRRRIGSRMPRNGPPFVSATQLRAVKRWIAAGATEDWVDQPDVDGGLADAAEPDTGLLPDADAVVDAIASDAEGL